MFHSVTLNSRRVAAALGALAIGTFAFAGSAAAAPVQLFPFLMSPPAQYAPPVQAAPADDDEGTVREMPARFKRQVVNYATREAPGTIVIDTPNTYLYYVLGGGQAIRYGIGVGREGFTWSGVQTITRKAEWPNWTPPAEMIARQPYLPRYMAGGPGNPLGARAMYLGGTIYRIHGTNAPHTIGTHVSSGCLRLTNEDVTDLYSRVNVGTKVIVLPMTAFFTETFGRKRYLTASIIVFVIASMLCGMATSLGALVLWRLVQGAGGAALLSTAQATLRQVFPREEQGIVQSLFLLGVIVAPTLGPTLGGYITDNASWHWCFFINLPIGIASAILVVMFLHDPPNQVRRTGGVDWLGISLLIIGVGCLQYVLEEGNSKDWFNSRLLVYCSIISAIASVDREMSSMAATFRFIPSSALLARSSRA